MSKLYTSSSGKVWHIPDMPNGHLHNSLAKLEREEPHRIQEIEDMRAEVAQREAAAQEAGQ